MGELAGGGSVAVGVGVSDMGEVKVTHDTLHYIFVLLSFCLYLSAFVHFGIGATIRTR